MNNTITSQDILYSFRRCPYAMRARLALKVSGADPQIREIELKDKPIEMLEASPKGTVPVLIKSDGTVIDESYDIMLAALCANDPERWLSIFDSAQIDKAHALIKYNDTLYKGGLDRYKYPNRFSDEGEAPEIREKGRAIVLDFWAQLDDTLKQSGTGYLFGAFSNADAAILPFIRQGAMVDKSAFGALPYEHVQKWLHQFLESKLFNSVMPKLNSWKKSGDFITLQKLQS